MADKTIPVRNMFEAWRRLDIDLLMDQLADDAVFENVPMDPIVGKEAIRAACLAFMERCTSAPWKVLNVAVSSTGAVLSERLDTFVLRDGSTAYIPAMGSYLVDDDNLVTRWRDYYDQADWNRQLRLDGDAGRGPGVFEAIKAEPSPES